ASSTDVGGSAAPHVAAATHSPVPASEISSKATPTGFSAREITELGQGVLVGLIGGGVPSLPTNNPSGPSLPGLGTSPYINSGYVSPASLPTSQEAAGISAPVVGASYPSPTSDLSTLDLRSGHALIGTPDGSLPASIDAGPSLSGYGASKNAPP